MLFDTHAHLDDSRFDEDRDQTLARAQAQGVGLILNVGFDLPSSERSMALAQQHDYVYAAVGIHPHDAKTVDENTMERLKDMAAHPKVVAIGEIGLDYYYDNSPRETQREVFRQQLELAHELAMPVIIHDRDAHDLGEFP